MSRCFSEFQLKELFRNRKFDSHLKTVSGKKAEIIRTGDSNSDTGPDFRNSLIKINGITYRGDIELHRVSSDWYAHNHHTDRNYNSVILHVVVEYDDSSGCVTQAGRKVETVELSGFLSADAEGFLSGIEFEDRLVSLRCSGENPKLSASVKLDFLRHMGAKRFIHKAGRFEERLKDIIDENRPVVFEAKQAYFRDFADLRIEHRKYDGAELRTESYWDQLFYEGILEGLGYSKNTAPFRKLARNAALDFLRQNSGIEELRADAILFGVAGLLPKARVDFDGDSIEYCAKLDAVWQSIRRNYRREFVDSSEWLFFKLRPQNFPTIRIAGAGRLVSGWLIEHTCGDTMREAFDGRNSDFAEVWRKKLVIPARDYWSRHFIFGTLATVDIRMLIGLGRAEEIIINTILPLTYLRGQVFGDLPLSERARAVYESHPPVADNAVTLIIKENLFGGDNILDSVQAQQGAIQLYRNLCSEGRCERCNIWKALRRKPAA